MATDCKIIMPQAPLRKVVCELGDEVNAWYDVNFTGRPDREMGKEFFNIWYDQEQLTQSVDLISELIELELKTTSKVFLGGSG